MDSFRFLTYSIPLLRFCLLHQSMFYELLTFPLFSPQVSMLEIIRVLNPDHTNVVKFFERFEHMGQTCLVFEILDRSLYELLQEREWKPLSPNEIWPIAKQVCIIVMWNQLFIVLRIYYSSVKKTLSLNLNPTQQHMEN